MTMQPSEESILNDYISHGRTERELQVGPKFFALIIVRSRLEQLAMLGLPHTDTTVRTLPVGIYGVTLDTEAETTDYALFWMSQDAHLWWDTFAAPSNHYQPRKGRTP